MTLLRVNVGCGQTATPGWLNFDSSPTVLLSRTPFWKLLPASQRAFAKRVREGGIRWGDARRLPLTDASVDVLYSSHMLEHLSRDHAREFLREALRVLRPGGFLRLAVPDLATLTRAYLTSGDADLFMEHSLLSKPLDKLPSRLSALLFGTRHHLWLYDQASLRKLLLEAGFAEAWGVAAGSTSIPGLGGLDLHERDSESCYVEAVK